MPSVSLAWLMGRMFLIPLQTFVYGMERIVETLRRVEKTAENGVLSVADEPAKPVGDPEVGCADREESKTMDKNLNDDMLKLVRFKILFVKRGFEYAFPEQESLVYDNLDASAFTAWKIAEFIQTLGRRKTEVPYSWGTSYPPTEKTFRDGDILLGFPEDDKKYLRVYFEVLERYHREKFRYEERQIEVLEEIRDRMPPASRPS